MLVNPQQMPSLDFSVLESEWIRARRESRRSGGEESPPCPSCPFAFACRAEPGVSFPALRGDATGAGGSAALTLAAPEADVPPAEPRFGSPTCSGRPGGFPAAASLLFQPSCFDRLTLTLLPTLSEIGSAPEAIGWLCLKLLWPPTLCSPWEAVAAFWGDARW